MKYCSLVSLCTCISLIFYVQAMEKSTGLLESLTPPEQVVKELAEQQKKGPQALVYTLLNCQSLLYLQELVMQKTKENLKLLDEIKHYEEEISQSPYYKHTKETGKYSLLLEYTRNNQEMLAIYFKLITLLHSYGLSLANMPEEKLQEVSRSLEAMEKMGSNDFAKAVLLDIQKTRADRKMTEAYDIIKAFLDQYEFSHIPKDACSQYCRSLEEIHKVTSAFRTILIDTEGEPSDEDYDRFNEKRKQLLATYFKDGIREACYQLYKAVKQKINPLALVLKRRGTTISRVSTVTQEPLPYALYSEQVESKQEQKSTPKQKPKPKSKAKKKGKTKQKPKKKIKYKSPEVATEKKVISSTSSTQSGKQLGVKFKEPISQEASSKVLPSTSKVFPDGSFIDNQKSDPFITYVVDPKNQVVLGIYDAHKVGIEIPVIKGYSKTIGAWRQDPQKMVENLKSQYRATGESVHNFALAVDSLIPTLGSLSVIPRSIFYNPATDWCITMAGFVKPNSGGDVKYCLFVYLVSKKTGICFHRNIEFRDGKQLYEGYRQKGYFEVEFPELGAKQQ